MEVMEQYYATVGPEGEIEIPAKFCETLGIVDGTRIAIREEGHCLILTPETTQAMRLIIKEQKNQHIVAESALITLRFCTK
jgi:bifunctional DNA-binding transcriptional regulator/antitoxin component of YhaV-PrlF toxin-antitoxin module